MMKMINRSVRDSVIRPDSYLKLKAKDIRSKQHFEDTRTFFETL